MGHVFPCLTMGLTSFQAPIQRILFENSRKGIPGAGKPERIASRIYRIPGLGSGDLVLLVAEAQAAVAVELPELLEELPAAHPTISCHSFGHFKNP